MIDQNKINTLDRLLLALRIAGEDDSVGMEIKLLCSRIDEIEEVTSKLSRCIENRISTDRTERKLRDFLDRIDALHPKKRELAIKNMSLCLYEIEEGEG